MKLSSIAALLGAVALAGCGTTSGVRPLPQQGDQTTEVNLLALATSEPRTPEAARQVGAIFFSHYADRNRDARRTRNIVNLVIWAASTYTAGAAGLGAHADNIFVGSLVGTSVSTLDNVLVPGGPQTSQGGMARTACVIRALDRASGPEILVLVASLRAAPEQTDAARAAIAQYENLFPRSISAYLTIYEAYLAGSSARLLSASAVGDAIAAANPKATDAGQGLVGEAPATGPALTATGQATAASALTARSDEIAAAMTAC